MKKSSLITSLLVALSFAFVPACKKDKKATDEAPAVDPAAKPADTPPDRSGGGPDRSGGGSG